MPTTVPDSASRRASAAWARGSRAAIWALISPRRWAAKTWVRSARSRARLRTGSDVTALAHALRTWALDDPHRYFLVYGTPVPGYHAPDDITAIAREIMAPLLDACARLPEDRPATPFDEHLEEHRDWAEGHPAPAAVLHRALTFWTRLHGALSLELAGHFTGLGFDPARFFAAELHELTGSPE